MENKIRNVMLHTNEAHFMCKSGVRPSQLRTHSTFVTLEYTLHMTKAPIFRGQANEVRSFGLFFVDYSLVSRA